jgi:hypothetical protein
MKLFIRILCLIAISQVPTLIDNSWNFTNWHWWAIDIPLVIIFTILYDNHYGDISDDINDFSTN